ncbi:hypothetical protein SKAU_G00257140 [Synaphobranchus kaupii]|uniref:Uncharacterized protein n=1 Tax=Synaphobranchus kaupii TaxID=118154 RepID=A0A9Q1IQC8_SYNKA|nr:hypothetical protein SKAU_G00257140 [Synaphobranchus kaupii]
MLLSGSNLIKSANHSDSCRLDQEPAIQLHQLHKLRCNRTVLQRNNCTTSAGGQAVVCLHAFLRSGRMCTPWN